MNYSNWKKGNTLPKNSKVLSIDPQIRDNLVCAGGRLKSTDLLFKCHSQIIIDKDHPIAYLIIKHYHEINLHAGREQTLYSLRHKYWITSCRGIIQRVIKNCSFCKHRSAKPNQPIMENIPVDR